MSWDAGDYVFAVLWIAFMVVLVYVATAEAGGCETVVIQDGLTIKTCVVCWSDWGQVTVRCF